MLGSFHNFPSCNITYLHTVGTPVFFKYCEKSNIFKNI